MNVLKQLFRVGSLALALGLAGSLYAAESEFDPDGFIYGEVTLVNGKSFRGILRWGGEEAFWDDIFNSSKRSLPYEEYIPEERLMNKKVTKILGITLKTSWEKSKFTRQFVIRFGDIAALEDLNSNEVTVVLKSGERQKVKGYSNDVGADIVVWDVSMGKIELDWKRLEKVVFMEAPPDSVAPDSRLQGTVETEIGSFKGFVQWDLQECLGGDLLDGDSEDGRLKIEMLRIASIERNSSSDSRVILRDGKELILSGTNDVNDDNRGICVEDARYGRVQIPWKRFVRASFDRGRKTGRKYSDYQEGQPLVGKATDRDGNAYEGQIVFDMDESRTWEILNGYVDDVEYQIPMGLIASLEPRGLKATSVRTKSGETLVLDGSADVDEENLGVLVIPDGNGKPQYIPWDRLKLLELK